MNNKSDTKTSNGVPVLGLLKNSPAYLAGVRDGDLIVEVNGQAIYTLGDYVEAKGLREGSQQMTLRREGKLFEVQYGLNPKPGGPIDYNGIVAEFQAEGALPGSQDDEAGSILDKKVLN